MNIYEGLEAAGLDGPDSAPDSAEEMLEASASEMDEDTNVEASIAEAFEQELAEARRTADENWDRVLRAEADLANYKKASERSRKDALSRQRRDLMTRFLEIADNLDLAAKFEDADRDALLEGLAGIRREIGRIFESAGVERIEAEGAAFDPNLHDAVSVVPMPDLDAEKVIAVERVGYTLDGGLLRPARVIIGRPLEGGSGG
jgi:molecular chaperone GrpE